ncbi:MAG: hypothetical protein QOF48_2538 [Verrucomicrobiota bacterium]|jgi:hypothetical protein
MSLQPSEGLVFQVAGGIYAAYQSTGRVVEGKEEEWMQRSMREAIQLAQMTELALVSDTELD